MTFRIVWYSRILRVHPESTKWTRRKKSPYKNKETTRYAEWNSPWQNMSYHRTKKEEWKNPKFRNTWCNYTLGLSWSTCSTWKQFDDLKRIWHPKKIWMHDIWHAWWVQFSWMICKTLAGKIFFLNQRRFTFSFPFWLDKYQIVKLIENHMIDHLLHEHISKYRYADFWLCCGFWKKWKKWTFGPQKRNQVRRRMTWSKIKRWWERRDTLW